MAPWLHLSERQRKNIGIYSHIKKLIQFQKKLDWEIALRELGYYPKGTSFYEIDDIDRCMLFINQDPSRLENPIRGGHQVNQYEYEKLKFARFRAVVEQELKKLGAPLQEDDKGNIITYAEFQSGKLTQIKHKKPIHEEYEQFDLMHEDHIIIPQRISLTEKGWGKIKEISLSMHYDEAVKERVDSLISIGRYDTAVREASLLIETSIKAFYKSKLYGDSYSLTDSLTDPCSSSTGKILF